MDIPADLFDGADGDTVRLAAELRRCFTDPAVLGLPPDTDMAVTVAATPTGLTVAVQDVATGRRFTLRHQAPAVAICDPDGQRLAVVGPDGLGRFDVHAELLAARLTAIVDGAR